MNIYLCGSIHDGHSHSRKYTENQPNVILLQFYNNCFVKNLRVYFVLYDRDHVLLDTSNDNEIVQSDCYNNQPIVVSRYEPAKSSLRFASYLTSPGSWPWPGLGADNKDWTEWRVAAVSSPRLG